MHKLFLIPLGGVENKATHCYCLQLGDNLFILDIGARHNFAEINGVKVITTNLDFLIKYKHKIRAMFVSSSMFSTSGGFSFLIRQLSPTFPIYASDYCVFVLKKHIHKYKLYANIDFIPITSTQKIHTFEFGNIIVNASTIGAKICGNVAFSFQLPIGNIVYLNNFWSATEMKHFNSNLLPFLTHVSQRKTILLIIPTVSNFGKNDYSMGLSSWLSSRLFNANGKIVCTLFNDDIFSLTKILELANKHAKKVYFCGLNALLEIKKLNELHYIENFSNCQFHFLENKYSSNSQAVDNNSIVVVMDSPNNLYNRILQMIFKNDLYLQINKNDSVLLLTSLISGLEIIATDVANEFAEHDINFHYFDYKNLGTDDTTFADIVFVVKTLSPVFLTLIGKNYQQHLKTRNLLTQSKFNEQQIVSFQSNQGLTYNGSHFVNFDLNSLPVKLGHVLHESDTIITTVRDQEERMLMGQRGVVVIVAVLQAKNQTKLLKRIFINAKGVLTLNTSKQTISELTKSINKRFVKPNLEWNESFKTKLKLFVFEYFSKIANFVPDIFICTDNI